MSVNGTVIEIEDVSNGDTQSTHLEVAADIDNNGSIGFKRGRSFLDVNRASEYVLDRVLCK